MPRPGRRRFAPTLVLVALAAVPAVGQGPAPAESTSAPDRFSQPLPGTDRMSRDELLAVLKVLQIDPTSRDGQAELLKLFQNMPEGQQQALRDAATRALGKDKIQSLTKGTLPQFPVPPGRDVPNVDPGREGPRNPITPADPAVPPGGPQTAAGTPSDDGPAGAGPPLPFHPTPPAPPVLSRMAERGWPGAPPRRGAQLKNRPDLARFLEFWKKNVGPSQSLERALRDIAGAAQDGGDPAGGPDGGGGFLSFLESEGSTAAEMGKLDWLEKTFEGESWKVPDLGLKDWAPKLSASAPDWHTPTAPAGGFSADGLSTGGGSWLPVILLAAVAGAVLLWRYWPRAAGAAHDRIDLTRGPWPVDPREIADRHALVRAFDYLSVLLCGDAARVWNHRTIATALRARVAGADAVADELAGLYEQARYTPPAEPLPPAALAAARRCLCQLAGVSPA